MCRHSPRSLLSDDLQRRGVADEFIERADEVGEARARRAVLLPAVQHQLVQVGGAVGGRRQPVVLLDGVDDLMNTDDRHSQRGRNNQQLSIILTKPPRLVELFF